MAMSKMKLASSLTYMRFLVGDDGRLLPGHASEDLRDFRFVELDRKSETERAAGWVEFCNAWGVDFRPGSYEAADNVSAFRLRIDTLRIPTTMLSAHVDRYVTLRCTLQNREKLSRREVEDVKVEVKRGLRAESLPTMALVPVVWDTEANEVRVFSGSSAVCTMFCELFEKCFNRQLTPVGLRTILALRGMPPEVIDGLSLLEPSRFNILQA